MRPNRTHRPAEALVQHGRQQPAMHDALVPAHAPPDMYEVPALAVVFPRADEGRQRELPGPLQRAPGEAVRAALLGDVLVRPRLVPLLRVLARAKGGEDREFLERFLESGSVSDAGWVVGM